VIARVWPEAPPQRRKSPRTVNAVHAVLGEPVHRLQDGWSRRAGHQRSPQTARQPTSARDVRSSSKRLPGHRYASIDLQSWCASSRTVATLTRCRGGACRALDGGVVAGMRSAGGAAVWVSAHGGGAGLAGPRCSAAGWTVPRRCGVTEHGGWRGSLGLECCGGRLGGAAAVWVFAHDSGAVCRDLR
jgi:hypothetical protein